MFPQTSLDGISRILLKQQENAEPLRNSHMSMHHEQPLTGGISLCFELD